MANLKCKLCEGKGRIPCASEKCKYSIDGNHEIVIDEAIEATCTKAGKTQGSHCSVCNTVITAQQTVAATGHTQVVEKGQEPNCTDNGYTDMIYCRTCKEIIQESQSVPALGHQWKGEPFTGPNGAQILTCERCGESKEDL